MNYKKKNRKRNLESAGFQFFLLLFFCISCVFLLRCVWEGEWVTREREREREGERRERGKGRERKEIEEIKREKREKIKKWEKKRKRENREKRKTIIFFKFYQKYYIFHFFSIKILYEKWFFQKLLIIISNFLKFNITVRALHILLL